MFREALGYPTRPPRGGRSILVGGTLLLLVAVVVAAATLDPPTWVVALLALLALIPWILVRGYYVRVVRWSIGRDSPTPPPFGNVRVLLRDGLAAVLIAVGYLLPGAAVLSPFVYVRIRETDVATALLGDAISPSVVTSLTAGAGVVALFAVFSIMGALFVLPVAVTRFAATGHLRAAFDLRGVASGAASEDYVVTWVVSLLLQVIILPVAYLLKPILVGFYLHFFVAVGVRYCYGQGVGASLDLDPVDPISTASASATATSTAGGDGSGEPAPAADEATRRSAVRPIEESERPELRGVGVGPSGRSVGDDQSGHGTDEHSERTAADRSEGERT